MEAENPFEHATKLVEAWLDGDGAPYARRVLGRGRAWDIDFEHSAVTGKPVRLSLPEDFPASPPQLHVDPDLCLKLPHVEKGGKVCLSSHSWPGDYNNPCLAVVRVLKQFNDELLKPSESLDWVEGQFHDERLSYWSRFCDQRRHAHSARPTATLTNVVLERISGWAEGRVAGYIPKSSRHRRVYQQVACLNTPDPHVLAQRHKWAGGTLVRGHAVFVEMPPEMRWTPVTWPQDFAQLDALVGRLTENEHSLGEWLVRVTKQIGKPRRQPKTGDDDPGTGPHPLLVILVQGTVLYGYQVFPSTVLGVTLPGVEPVNLTRVDPAWCLTRDQAPASFSARQAKKVLVLGCGSLGSPLVELLARAGVGTLDIIDFEVFDGPNTARHVLGLKDTRRSKAAVLAERLKEDIPGIVVNGYYAKASTWVTTKCKPGTYDLVVDCTAESAVRTLLTHWRKTAFGHSPIIHTWVEPFCAAAHVVLSQSTEPWPLDDPADRLVNAADFSDANTRIDLPACSAGFYPYGAADVWQAAAFATERVLAALDDHNHASTVWSWVRSKSFFDGLGVNVHLREIVPTTGGRSDSVMLTRNYKTVLGSE